MKLKSIAQELNLNTVRHTNLLLGLAVVGILGYGCGSDQSASHEAEKPKEEKKFKADSTRSTLFQVGDEIFSIPSPVQSASLLKTVGAEFSKDFLSDPNNSGSYSTKFQKAVNLGVYGADLGYVTIYEQTQHSLMYLNATKKIGDNLGVSSAFSPELMERFEANMGNQDSMLVLVSAAYRASDSYLKNNEGNDVGGLILAGGWIEALYFTCQAVKDHDNDALKRRVGEQKASLEHLIKLLQGFMNQSDEIADFVDDLIDLYHLFDGVEESYTFAQPTTDVENQVTVINSTSSVSITGEQIDAITAKLAEIRNNITG